MHSESNDEAGSIKYENRCLYCVWDQMWAQSEAKKPYVEAEEDNRGPIPRYAYTGGSIHIFTSEGRSRERTYRYTITWHIFRDGMVIFFPASHFTNSRIVLPWVFQVWRHISLSNPSCGQGICEEE